MTVFYSRLEERFLLQSHEGATILLRNLGVKRKLSHRICSQIVQKYENARAGE